MKTILCSSDQKERIYHQLASGSGAAADISLVTVSQLLRLDTREDREAALLAGAHALQKISADCPIYRDMFIYPAFLEEILSFARECALWRIAPASLPADTPAELELQQILKTVLSLPLEEKEIAARYDELLQKAAALENLSLSDLFETDPFRRKFLRDLRALRPDLPCLQEDRLPGSSILYYAQSPRQEIEACAQHIIADQQPCTVVLAGYEAQLPVLRQVFRRYGIPFSAFRVPLIAETPAVYAALARYALQPGRLALLQILQQDALPACCPDDLLAFLQDAQDPSRPACSDALSSDLLAAEKKRTARLEARADRYFRAVEEDLRTLREAGNPQAALQAAFAVLQRNPCLKQPGELSAALSIRSLLGHAMSLIDTPQDAEFLIRRIEGMKVSIADPLSLFCTVTDLTHPAPAAAVTYLLGCSGRQYPGIPVRKGLFDEAYVSRIAGYPSLAERHDAYLEQLQWVFRRSDQLICSYATNDYQGREIQLAFAIDSRFAAPGGRRSEAPWPLAVTAPARMSEHRLDPALARALFTAPDGEIHSSISSIERWFLCPYSYFLQSGLKARAPQIPALDSSTIGTFQHAFLQHAVSARGKDYPGFPEDIHAFMEPLFAEMARRYPLDAARLRLSRERLEDSLRTSLAVLKEAEASTIFRPAAAEQPFAHQIVPGVELHGVIDRLDTSNGTFRILDYKSSEHTLSESRIKAGLQLQLLSYLMAAAAEQGMKPAGAYYISLRDAAAEDAAAETRTTGFAEAEGTGDPAALQEKFLEKRRLSGWAFEVPEDSIADYSRCFTPAKRYYFEEIRSCMEALYRYFAEQLLSGSIAVDPVDTACDFCDYRPICRFAGSPRKSAARVDAEKFSSETLKDRKEES